MMTQEEFDQHLKKFDELEKRDNTFILDILEPLCIIVIKRFDGCVSSSKSVSTRQDSNLGIIGLQPIPLTTWARVHMALTGFGPATPSFLQF